MSEIDELSSLLRPKFDARLQRLLEGIDLAAISRLPAGRLKEKALPNIGVVEMVPGSAFAKDYNSLYVANFHGGERERSDLIVTRLEDDFSGRREGLFPYRIVGLRNPHGVAIAGAQFSVLFLPDGKRAVPYLQYIYVHPDHRRQDLSELLHTLVLAVAMADAASANQQDTPMVPFTLFETQPPVYGKDEAQRAAAEERTRIHTKSGSMALMLRRKADGVILSAHVQPGLEPGEEPFTIIWVVRANPMVELALPDRVSGLEVIAAYYQSLRDEGFPEKNIALAESIFRSRCEQGCEFCLMPLSDVTREMYINIDQNILK